MNEREKRLLAGFLTVVLLGVSAKYLYPAVVKPILNYGQDLEEARDSLESLEARHDVLQTGLKAKYEEFVSRNGHVDAQEVQYLMSERIEQELRAANLRKSDIKQKGISVDRKTNIATLAVSCSADGKFADCVQFIEAVYRFPYVLRFRTLKLTPTPARQKANHDEVTIDAEVEAIVLPEEELFGVVTLAQPKTFERMKTSDLQRLLKWKPFTPYHEPPPPRSTPTPTPRPTAPKPEPKPPSRHGPPSSGDASETVLNMVLCYGQLAATGPKQAVDEVRLKNTQDESARYVAVGGSLDEGTLVLVNAFGEVVRKQTDQEDFGYFVYPIGERLSDSMPLVDAREWPEIQYAMSQYLEKEKERLQAAAAAADGDDPDFVGPPVPPEILEGPPWIEDGPTLEDDLLGPPAPEAAMVPESAPVVAAGDAKAPRKRTANRDSAPGSSAKAKAVKSSQPANGRKVQKGGSKRSSKPASGQATKAASPTKSRPGMSRRAVRKRPPDPAPGGDSEGEGQDRPDE